MRTKVLGIAAAAVAAGTLSFGLQVGSVSPAGAAGGVEGGNISWSGALPSEVDVTATSPGDAVAVWAKPVPGGERIYASHGLNGGWSAPINVIHSVAVAVENLHVVGNATGDVAAVWTQSANGQERVRSARYLGGGQWDGPATLSAADTTGINETVAAMDAAGRVHVVISADKDSADPIRAAIWAKGAAPVLSQVSTQGWDPSLDVSPSGVAVTAFEALSNGLPAVKASRRTASTGWTAPDVAPWPGEAILPAAAVADDGAGTIIYRGKKAGVFELAAARVGANGQVGNPDQISTSGLGVTGAALDVSPAGTAMATWTEFNGTHYSLHVATRAAVGDFNPPSVYDADTNIVTTPTPFASDSSRRILVHNGHDRLTFRYRTSAVHALATYDGGVSDGEIAADADSQGNVAAVSIVENGGSSYVQADWLDVTGPTSAPSTSLKGQTLATGFPVAWTSTDALSNVASTDVIVSTSAWNQTAFTDPAIIGNNLVSGPLDFTGKLGRTYCFETQAVDTLGNLGARSALRCTSVPLDDPALKGSGWTRAAKSGHFNGTLTSTTAKGRQLVRTGVDARRLALVATKVPNGGTVQVSWNNKVIKTISLKGTTAKKKVLSIITFKGLRSGTVKIKVTSANGRPVHIDGLVVAK